MHSAIVECFFQPRVSYSARPASVAPGGSAGHHGGRVLEFAHHAVTPAAVVRAARSVAQNEPSG